MKTQSILIFTTILLLSTVGITSCKKNDTGGKASLHVMVYHHSTPIINPVIYVKFGTQSKPGDPIVNYDLKVEGEVGENHVHIEDLRMGEYYLYAIGYDSIAKMPVAGGIAAKIKWSERKERKSLDLLIH